MIQRTGVLFVGALGSVATTTIAGALAVKNGLSPLRGVISTETAFEHLDMPPLEGLVFGGWDIRQTSLTEITKKHDIVSKNLVEEISEELEQIPIWQAPLVNVGTYVRGVYHVEGDDYGLWEAASELEQHIQQFKQENQLERVVVINTASTEENVEPNVAYQSLEAFEQGLKNNSSDIRPGMLYAYAALKTKSAYVNFTPSVTVDIPALQELAEIQGVPLAGKDARTGQTLYKHVLGKMFKLRGMKIVGWYSTNILGNEDGEVLEDPDHSATKISSKTTGLEQVLGYDDFDHRVRIDYFPVRGDRKEAWDTIEFEGWLGERMSMKVNWLGTDSVLAAPLIIDLARFMDHALRDGLTGIMTHLSLFFKSPYQTDQLALDEQYQELLAFAQSRSHSYVNH